jgi:hypothetical protein
MHDLEPWEREKQISEAREHALAMLHECDQMLAQRAAEAAERVQSAMPAPEPPRPVRRAVTPRQRPAPAPPVGKIVHTRRDADGNLSATVFEGNAAASAHSWEAWIRTFVGRQITAFAEGFGGDIGDVMAELRKAERERVDARLAELEARLGALLGEFEERLKQAEARAAGGPRLVDDAAAD